jgi:hypothetical protein
LLLCVGGVYVAAQIAAPIHHAAPPLGSEPAKLVPLGACQLELAGELRVVERVKALELGVQLIVSRTQLPIGERGVDSSTEVLIELILKLLHLLHALWVKSCTI